MKKILSSILATVLLASVIVVPAAADGASNITVDVPYLSQMPTFDGVINADEWGDATVTVDGATAAIPGSTAPSAANTFAWYDHTYDAQTEVYGEIDEAGKAAVTALSYDLWFRWNEEYFFLAAEVNDPDGYCLPAGRGNIWNGDCLQFRVDPMGPNSYLTYKNPDYDYTLAPFDYEAAMNVGCVPWAYAGEICNIGLGMVKNAKGEWDYQAYDMADDGCGNMTAPMQINDPKKLGPDGSTTIAAGFEGTNLASEFMMTTADGKNVYEVAVPWAYLDQWGLNDVGVGSIWGISVVNLMGDAAHNGFYAYLAWGCGICGAQHDDANLRPTLGGSNAMVLSDKDAITGETIADLPQYTAPSDDPDAPVINNIIDGRGMNAYYLGSTPELAVTDGDFEVYFDIAFIGKYPTNPERTQVGIRIGEGYGYMAGWDGDTGEFFVAPSNFDAGIDKSMPYVVSDEAFEWTPGEWHNLGISVMDDTVAVIFDGEVVVEDTDSNYSCGWTTEFQQIIYNLGDFVFDNFEFYNGQGEATAIYSLDSNDDAYNHSDFKLASLPMSFETIPGECKEIDPDSDYGCLMVRGENAEGKPCMVCGFCGAEGELLSTPGDCNGDEKVNMNDASLILKYAAKWEVELDLDAADCNKDGKVNMTDASLILKYAAKWDVELK